MAEEKRRQEIVETLDTLFRANIYRHKVNIDIMLEKNVGVAEHPDVLLTIEEEIAKMAEWEDKLEVLRKYFSG